MLVQHFLEHSAARRPDHMALVCRGRRRTYREVDEEANRLAHALRASGVQRGDRVMIQLPTSIETVVAIFAALKAGAIFIVLHPGTRRDKLALLLADAEPTALVADSSRVGEALDVIAGTPSLRCCVWVDDAVPGLTSAAQVVRWSDLEGYPATRPPCHTIDVDLATLIYTSGSTGTPKGVMPTHANMVAAATSINAYVQNTEDDVILDVLPLAFDYGLYQIFLAFQVGARVVLESGFAFPARTVALMEQEGVTGLAAVPTLVALLLKYPDLLARTPSSLRYITNTAAALPVSHIMTLRQSWPDVRIFSMYGLTECKRVSYLPPEELDRRPDSVGIAIPGTEVYVVGDDGQRLGAGCVGELVVRGSHVTRGYWRAPELTADRFRPGPMPGETVLHTGDLFRMDAEGFLYFVARKDDVIKSRGEKVSPREVENAVCQLEGVAEAAVVGVPDPVLGQAIALTVTFRAGALLTERVVRAHCARVLDDYMQPKHIRIVGELPRTENGKVDKRSLSTELAECAALPVS
ncbi:MAG: AMP-binding protein [Chloroflexi bacterium]|nr:AMP-binding protein [Chloroflexota bacterium]